MSRNTGDIFVADPEGFRSMNLDRPAAHLVRELVQNALDEEGVTNLNVLVTYHGPRQGTTVKVVDDAPNGVADPKLLFTIFMSNKEDSPTKRGRMGRGLKEIVSVANMTTIRSMGMDALRFVRHQGGRWERKSMAKLGRTEKGTEVVAFCRAWGKADAASIVAFLKRVRAPGNITFCVAFVEECSAAASNIPIYETIAPFVAAEVYHMTLPTVIYETDGGDRKARDRQRFTDVHCFVPPPGETSYIYELGIPVEECKSSPVSIDVQQRVILRERRDTVTDSYRRELLACVLDKRMRAGKIENSELTSNAVLVAAQSPYNLSSETRERIAQVWTGGMPYAASKEDFQRATGSHVNAVLLKTLPEAIREIVRMSGQNVRDVLNERRAELCPVLSGTDLTLEMRKLVTFWEYLAEGLKRPCKVVVAGGMPSASASFDRTTNTLTLYVGMLGAKFFKQPAGAEQLGLFLHEMAHWEPKVHEHGVEFHADSENIGGKLAAFMLNNAEQVRLHLNAEVQS